MNISKTKNFFFNSLLVLFGLLLGLVLSEISVRFFNLDIRSMRPLLFYQMADLDVYEPSTVPGLIYQHKPGSEFLDETEEAVHPKETLYKTRLVKINSMGLRMPEPFENAMNRKRILIVGSSNTYGALVSGPETYPSRIQARLEEKYPGQFQIYNAGHCAYVLGQKIRAARLLLDKIKPHLIIIEDSHNGRRAFLPDQDLTSLFHQNPDLYQENLPLEILKDSLVLHTQFLGFSALYRMGIAQKNLISLGGFHPLSALGFEPVTAAQIGEDHPLADLFDQAADRISKEVTLEFLRDFPRESREFELFHFLPIGDQYCQKPAPAHVYEGMDSFGFCKEGLGREYNRTHPPSYVYDWYAKNIITYLEKRSRLFQ